MIPRLDARKLASNDPSEIAGMKEAATVVGFATVHSTGISADRVSEILGLYKAFFDLPERKKSQIDMARTGANRGWGASGSEQVDPAANPDYKQVFDCGFEVSDSDPRAGLDVYAPNLWPEEPIAFRLEIESYYTQACDVAMGVLRAVATAISVPANHFDNAFDAPMALLRGNYYPSRPEWATEHDFGIASHTDYGCLTLLATDGSPGLEVRQRGGGWLPVSAPPGEFIINFGEMMDIWSEGAVRATPHRVIGAAHERLSVPLFFNPSVNTNIAPIGSGTTILAGDHLARRFRETYVHLQK